MKRIDMEKLTENSCGDNEMLVELVTMGINRIDKSSVEIKEALKAEEWDDLSRIIHKLRPILFYAGLICLNEELQQIEKNSKERIGLSEIPGQIDNMFIVLQEAKLEMNEIISNL